MLESHRHTAASFRQSLFLVRVTDRGSNCRLNILNCRILKLFFSKTGNVSASDGTDYCARRWLTAPLRHLLAVLKPFFSKTVRNVTGLQSIKNVWNISPTHYVSFCVNANQL